MCNMVLVSDEKSRKEGGAFLQPETKVAGNCMKWIDPVKIKFPLLGRRGGRGGRRGGGRRVGGFSAT